MRWCAGCFFLPEKDVSKPCLACSMYGPEGLQDALGSPGPRTPGSAVSVHTGFPLFSEGDDSVVWPRTLNQNQFIALLFQN